MQVETGYIATLNYFIMIYLFQQQYHTHSEKKTTEILPERSRTLYQDTKIINVWTYTAVTTYV